MRVEAKLARDHAARISDEMTGQFQPINDDHAIEQVTFTIGFAQPLSDAVLALFRRRHELWSELLPAIREPAGFALQIEEGNPVRFEKAPGVEFAFVRPDGSPVWAMRILGHEILVECTRYSRWERVWGAARKHLGNALDVLAESGEPNAMVRAALVVQDAFKVPTADYDLGALFVSSPLLPQSVFSRGANWHAHSGWFTTAQSCRVLHNLNADGVENDGDGFARVRLVHLMTALREESAADTTAAARGVWLSEVMEKLHLENKDLVGALLQPALLDRIGMPATS